MSLALDSLSNNFCKRLRMDLSTFRTLVWNSVTSIFLHLLEVHVIKNLYFLHFNFLYIYLVVYHYFGWKALLQLDRYGFCQKICCKVCAHRSRHLGDQGTNPPFIRSAYESLQTYHTLHNEMSHLSVFQISDAFTRLSILQTRLKCE